MRYVILLIILECLFYCVAHGKEIEIPPITKVKVNRLGKVEVKCKTQVKWINLHDDLDLIPDSNGKSAMVMSSRPGMYTIAVYTASKDGPSDPEYAKIMIEGATPLPPGGPDKSPDTSKKANPVKATAKLRIGSAGCTATVIGPQRADGYWDALTAAHCLPGGSKAGSIALKDGRTFPVKVAEKNATADLLWLVVETKEILDYALLSATAPAIGTGVWHNGYGFDRPGNVEYGTVTDNANSQGQLRFTLNVSSGDSGGGIFREDNGELVAAVCCTTRIAGTGSVYGGTSVIASKMRRTVSLFMPIQSISRHEIENGRRESRLFSPNQEPFELFRPILTIKNDTDW